MNSNLFFLKKKIKISNIFPKIKIDKNFIVHEVKSLQFAEENDLTFFDSIKYKLPAANTRGSACITTEKLEKFLPQKVKRILVKNVLLELALALKKVYPYSDIDYPDLSLKQAKIKNHKLVKFGNNVLVGKNVKIGKNTIIGSNTIIEHNVLIGENCVIGSGSIIKNSIIGSRVMIQDGCKIGQKGFGFIPINNKNIKFPHIGKVIIEDDVEIASGCTIDRGSVNDTKIGKNTI